MSFPVFVSGDVLNASDMNAVGMWKTSATTFTSASSHSVNNCFSSSYDAYRVVVYWTSSTTLQVTMRLRVGGVDNSGASSYGITTLRAFDSTTGSTSANQSSFAFSGVAQTERAMAVFDIVQPAVAVHTLINGITTQGLITENSKCTTFWGRHDQSVAYDGFTLIASTGNITGYVKVFGYRN